MAIIRQAVNLTAGLGETIYTVPVSKQATVSISVNNASDTYVAIQTSDLASTPVANSAGSFGNDYFGFFNNTVGYFTTGNQSYTIRRLQSSSNWVASDAFDTSSHPYQIPYSTSFNYNAGIARFQSSSSYWRSTGAFDSSGDTLTGNNVLQGYGAGAASISTEGLSFQQGNTAYTAYYGLHASANAVVVTSSHFQDLTSGTGRSVQTYCGANLYNGNSTHYIYVPLRSSSDAPVVVMWDSGDINTNTSNYLSRATRFTGIPNGVYTQWIQESGGYTMIATSDDAGGTSDPKLWIVNNSAWIRGAVNSIGDTTVDCTQLTNASWSSLTFPARNKPFVEGNTGKFYFRNPSSPYPFFYNAVTDTWDTTGYPTVVSYPAEISGLEATLGDAYSFYKFGSSLNDYYIVAGTNKYTLTPNYASLAANSGLLNNLQNDSEKGGLTLKAGDKVIAYDTLSGGTVVQVYGYEEDA